MNDFFDLNCFLLDPKLSEELSDEHVRTWLKYKSDELKDNEGKIVDDPDSSDGARYFYKELWGERLGITVRECRNTFSRRPSKYVQGDWMCSVWTTLKYALQQTYGKNKNGDKWWQKPKIEKTFTQNGSATKKTFAGILKHSEEFSEVFEDTTVQEFIRAAYTSANLIIVPDGFNTERYKSTKDYWDLTLKKFYQGKEPLDHRLRNDDGRYDVATPFRKLLKKNQKKGDPLCLSPWINEHGKPLRLSPWINEHGKPNFSSYSYEENNAYWHKLMQEMTSRINLRRELMAQYIDQLQKE